MSGGWCVTVGVDVRPPSDARTLSTETGVALDLLLDHLADMHGVVAGDDRGWSGTVTVDADGIDAARGLAVAAVLDRAAVCGLPITPLTRIEVIREDIRDAELTAVGQWQPPDRMPDAGGRGCGGGGVDAGDRGSSRSP